jgi:hypothetical protein
MEITLVQNSKEDIRHMDGFWFHYFLGWIDKNHLAHMETSMQKDMLYYRYTAGGDGRQHIRNGSSGRSRSWVTHSKRLIKPLEVLAAACDFVGDGAYGEISTPVQRDTGDLNWNSLAVYENKVTVVNAQLYVPLSVSLVLQAANSIRRMLRVMGLCYSVEERIEIPRYQDLLCSLQKCNNTILANPNGCSWNQKPARLLEDQKRFMKVICKCFAPARKDGVPLPPKRIKGRLKLGVPIPVYLAQKVPPMEVPPVQSNFRDMVGFWFHFCLMWIDAYSLVHAVTSMEKGMLYHHNHLSKNTKVHIRTNSSKYSKPWHGWPKLVKPLEALAAASEFVGDAAFSEISIPLLKKTGELTWIYSGPRGTEEVMVVTGQLYVFLLCIDGLCKGLIAFVGGYGL